MHCFQVSSENAVPISHNRLQRRPIDRLRLFALRVRRTRPAVYLKRDTKLFGASRASTTYHAAGPRNPQNDVR